MVICALTICANDSRMTTAVLYYCFPKDSLIFSVWVTKCKRKDIINTKHARVCSAHFDENSYKDELRLLELHLKKEPLEDAVPTINIGNDFNISIDRSNRG